MSVIAGDPVIVRIFAYAAQGVRTSARLLRELNEIQGRTLSVSFLHHGAAVLVSQTISPVGVTRPIFAQALSAVGDVADDIGVPLASMFGGSTPFDLAESESEDAA